MDIYAKIDQVAQGRKPSKAVAQLIEDYEATNIVIRDLQEEMDGTDDEDERSDLSDDIKEMTAKKSEIESKIDVALVKWQQGMQRMENMHKKMKESKGISTPKPAAQSTAPVSKAAEVPLVDTEELPNPPAKKSNLGWIIGGVALILTLGAVNFMKKD